MTASRLRRFSWLAIPLAVVLYFSGPIVRNQVLIPGDILGTLDDIWRSPSRPHNPLQSDVLFQFYPWQTFTFDRIRHGELPLWNPYSLSGTPFLANDQSAVLDPVRLLTLASGLSAAGSFLWGAVIRLSLFGLLVFLWLHGRGFRRGPAVIAAVAAAFSTASLAWVSYPLFATFLWLPLILFAVDLSQRRGRLGTGLIAAGTAAQFFSGNIQISLYVLLVVGLYAGCVIRPLSRRLAFATLGGVVLGSMLAAVQLLPTWSFVRQSGQYETGRSGYGSTSLVGAVRTGQWNGWTSWRDVKVNLQNLLPVAWPFVQGNPATGSYRFPGADTKNNFNELAGSVGTIGLILAVAGAVSFWRERLVKFSVLTSVVSLGVIAHAPVFELVNYLPLIQKTSTGRLRFVIVLSLAVLVAYGVRALVNGERKTQRVFTVVGGLVVAGWTGIAFLIGRSGARKEEALLLGISIIILTAAVWMRGRLAWRLGLAMVALLLVPTVMLRTYNTSLARSDVYPESEVISLLKQAAGPDGRIVGLSLANSLRAPLLPNGSMLYGLHDIRGYEVVRLKKYDELVDGTLLRSGSYLNRIVEHSSVVNYLGVRAVVMTDQDAAQVGAQFESDNWKIFGSAGGMTVYQNTQTIPRAIVRTESLDIPATITGETANTLTVRASSPTSGILMLLDSYDDGWTALVDGQTARVSRYGDFFRSVEIPAGEHTVRFKYQPRAFVVGAWISVSALFVTIGLGVIGLKQKQTGTAAG